MLGPGNVGKIIMMTIMRNVFYFMAGKGRKEGGGGGGWSTLYSIDIRKKTPHGCGG